MTRGNKTNILSGKNHVPKIHLKSFFSVTVLSPAGSLMQFTVQFTKYGKVSLETDFWEVGGFFFFVCFFPNGKLLYQLLVRFAAGTSRWTSA